ncbi:phosphoribosylformylglycinamidine synthase II [Candidatus Peribacteria bacterium RIFCSPHIGHO2_02_FULL_52_16]|nr:MAG: phosphoribosylformylglycinamidine synthase II [Candidatus Peribacteria bacterium RIFCSPHIGHO2_01_FULL_51_35]OGJ61880.1 MAG: phosphoribosylformylglycinamidine synthase II [Candidatus Peribacteria bacterium RIFCSPHIGHO2_02_FULL_52_16]
MSPISTSSPTLPFSTMSDADVREQLRKYQIGLTVEEARKIESLLGRAPTVVEAVIWGIQGSEHCSYKSSRRFLKMFPTTGKHVILGPKEDSGIVAITDAPAGKRWGLVISHESHNHPSQIVPFEGAATGVGGTVRDVVCMGARVIGCMDLLRLGDLKTDASKTIAKEVARGIAGYGNPLGIPNLGGDTVFDSSYNANCLVNAVAMGIVREDEVIHSYVPDEAADAGYDIIIVGKPTDRSGFGGAAFASISMEEDKREQNTGAVQEPNPFLERHLLASTYALFDWLAREKHLDKVSFKDLGAGGVVCSSVEQVADKGFGADVELTKVHVSVQNLPPEVIACAETQERFCWICHPSLTQQILTHYNKTWDLPSVAENARASVIGKVNGSGIYRLTHKGEIVCEAKATDITQGLLYTRPTESKKSDSKEPTIACHGKDIAVTAPITMKTDITSVFLAMLSHPNGASKDTIIRHYDKDVIGNTQIEAGEADAGVLMPLQDLASYAQDGEHPGWQLPEEERYRGVAFAGDGNGRYGRISAYAQGVNAAVESMCNVAAVGAIPRALTDCLNFGNPEIPSHLGALEDAVRGIADAAKGITFEGEPVPVISGNVSLYNSLPNGNAIDPTAIVCSIGVMKDGRKAVDARLKKSDSVLLLLGERKDECGGSLYYDVLESMADAPRDSMLGKNVPGPNFQTIAAMIRLLNEATEQSLLLSCHDISDGGLLLALLEMAAPVRKIGGKIGMSINLNGLESNLRTDTILFSQTSGFILEVSKKNLSVLEKIAAAENQILIPLGNTQEDPSLHIERNGSVIVHESIPNLLRVWKNSLKASLR